MRKQHILSRKLPIVSMILVCLLASMVIAFAPANESKPWLNYINQSLSALVMMFLFSRWFSPDLKGFFKAEVPMKEILILSVPFVIKCVLSQIGTIVESGFYFNPTMVSFAMALSAGFCEEAMFRTFSIPIGMGYLKSKHKIMISVLLTSLAFGALHLGNIAGGASVKISIVQAIATFFGGVFYAAIYLRTGCVWVGIIMHAVYDWMCFVGDPTLKDGIVATDPSMAGIIFALAIDVALGIAGFYMIRPAMHGRIEEVWKRKWNIDAV